MLKNPQLQCVVSVFCLAQKLRADRSANMAWPQVKMREPILLESAKPDNLAPVFGNPNLTFRKNGVAEECLVLFRGV